MSQYSGMNDSPIDSVPSDQLGGEAGEALSFAPAESLGGDGDSITDFIPGTSLGGDGNSALDVIPGTSLGGDDNSSLDIIPGSSLGGDSDEQLIILVAGTGPVSSETFEADLAPADSLGPVSAETFDAVTLPPPDSLGPVFVEMFEVPAPPPPPPPPPSVPFCPPDALCREYDPDLGESVTVQGGPVPTPFYTAINPLTPAQWDFLAARQFGADGAIPLPQVGRFTGPAYPFGPSWALTLGPKTDLEVIFTSIANIITTILGTIPYAPLRGSEDPNLVFEPNDAITQGLIRYFTKRDLSRQEPRAKILTVRTMVPEDDPHKIVVTVAFQIVGDPDGRIFSAPVEYNTLSLAV